jgi:uncharacterized protein YcbK (DUF882 family)
MKYTIKSTSDEGVYFLVCRREKHHTFWISEAEVNKDIEKAKAKFFTAPRYAKASLTKLLKVMDDYRNDHFEMVTF